jgi:ParB family chromosome partitioning protein
MTSRKSEQPYRAKARNLDILFGDDTPEDNGNFVSLDRIELSVHQPRRYFSQEKLQELSNSIRQYGVLENLLVRPLPTGGDRYELIAGERRYRAAQLAGLQEVPVTIRELTDEEAIQIALVENLQREDLNPVEETEGILQLLAIHLKCAVSEVPKLLYRLQNEVKGKVTDNVVGNSIRPVVEEVFQSIGTLSWESFIQHRLPLLKLPEDVLEALQQGQLAYTKAKAIARLKDAEVRRGLLQEAIAQDLSLSEIRQRVKTLGLPEVSEEATPPLKQRLRAAYHLAQKASFWNDPKKQKKLEKVLEQLEALVMTD